MSLDFENEFAKEPQQPTQGRTLLDNDFAEAPKPKEQPEADDDAIDALVAESIQRTFGMSAEEVKQKLTTVAELERGRHEAMEAQKFLQANPEYVAIPKNAQALEAVLREHNLPLTSENLTKAYQHLKSSGGLETANPQRAARPTSTGISDFESASMPTPKQAVSDEDIAKEIAGMSLEDARLHMQRRMYEARTQGQRPY